MLLYLFGLHKSQNISLSLSEYVAENLELFHDSPNFAGDFDSLICLACTMANASIFTTTRSLFPTNMMLLKDPNDYCSREDNGSACLLVPFVGFFFFLLVSFVTKGHQ